MGKVVLSKEDIKKLDKLINMFEKQKKEFEKFKKEYQDGIIDFESPTDIILYDAYIVLGKLIKRLPDVEGSDIFQEYVNVVLNDLIGDFSKLEEWCTQMLDTTTSLFNSVAENYNDMLELDLLAEELSQMHNIPLENVNIGNDSPKIMKLLSSMLGRVNTHELKAEIIHVYKFMYRTVCFWPDTFKLTLDQIDDIYSLSKEEERVNKMKREIPDLFYSDSFDNMFGSLYKKSSVLFIELFREITKKQINDGIYNDKDMAIASSILLVYDQMSKCLESYTMAQNSFNKFSDIRKRVSFCLIDILQYKCNPYCYTGKYIFANDLVSFFDLLYPISILLDWRNLFLNTVSGSLDLFSACSAFNNGHYNGSGMDRSSYVPLANDISREVQNLSIDEKIDYYLEHMAKYREEMIRENGVSLVNVLKARMEQLEGNVVTNCDSLEQEPKGRTGR